MQRVITAILILVLLPGQFVLGESITIPSGTAIYGELDETVTSRKKETTVGDIVRARVWRNVVVNGTTVIRAGEPLLSKVSVAKPAKIAGRKGNLELEAVSTRTVDGAEILLDGGYDKSGKGRKGLSVTLFALVAWPLIFIKGKQATLEAGTVFDGVVQADTDFALDDVNPSPPKIRLGGTDSKLELEPLYDEIDESGKSPDLPIQITVCDDENPLETASVVTVNESEIEEIKVALGEVPTEGECQTSRGILNLKELGKHFTKGINRFEISVGEYKEELVLDVEL